MKIRNGFVSNSSSSSFVIYKGFLSQDQINKILDYESVVQEYLNNNPDTDKFEYFDWGSWKLQDFNNFIFGETSMDNFDFDEFFNFIGTVNVDVCWDDGYIEDPTPRQRNFISEQIKKLRKNKLENLK